MVLLRLAILVAVLYIMYRVDKAGASYNPEACVYDKIMTGYNRHVRPVSYNGQVVNISMAFVLRSLADIEERNEKMTVVGYFRLGWYDTQLKWNPSECNGTEVIKIAAEQIWIPEFIISNSLIGYHQYTFKRDFGLWIRHDGHIYWAYGGLFTVSCDLDLTNYPFDSHNCSLIHESWLHNTTELNIIVEGAGRDKESKDDDPVWSLKGLDANYHELEPGWPAMRVSFKWNRKYSYPMLNIVCPTFFIMAVALAIFWLPAECGEKISLSVTVLLAFSVIQLVIMDLMPPNSDNLPNISLLVLGVMIMSTMSVLTSMLAVYMTFKPASTPVPRRVRKLVYNYLAKLTGLQSELPHKEFKEIDPYEHVFDLRKKDGKRDSKCDIFMREVLKTMGDLGTKLDDLKQEKQKGTDFVLCRKIEHRKISILEGILVGIQEIVQYKHVKLRNDDIVSEWKTLAKIVDRLIFIFIILSLIIFLIITSVKHFS